MAAAPPPDRPTRLDRDETLHGPSAAPDDVEAVRRLALVEEVLAGVPVDVHGALAEQLDRRGVQVREEWVLGQVLFDRLHGGHVNLFGSGPRDGG